MSSPRTDCQNDLLMCSSRPTPWLIFNIRRLSSYGCRHGLIATCRRLLLWLKRPFVPSHRRGISLPAALHLQAGELVEVKSEKEIRETQDENGRTAGLVFMPAMSAYCGTRLKVYKRVRQIVLENSAGVRSFKETVLLEGAICDGNDQACDRSCFFFWREAWLRRVSLAPDSSRTGRH